MLNNSQMNVLEAIESRISVRKYTGERITKEELDTLLYAGFCAPSAMNRRPWQFIVVQDPQTLQDIADHGNYTKMMPQAGTCIVVCGDQNVTQIPELLTNDCSAAIQNILLAARGIGLGTVWCGMVKNQEFYQYVHDRLSLPENVVPEGLIAVGYPAEHREHPERFEAEKVHFEKW